MAAKKPTILKKEWANTKTSIDDIRIPSQDTSDFLIANFPDGIPEGQETDVDAGGAYASRADLNGILQLITKLLVYINQGGQFTIDNGVITGDGYDKDVILYDVTSKTYQRSLINANKANFVTNRNYLNDGVNWETIDETKDILNVLKKLTVGTAPNLPLTTMPYDNNIALRTEKDDRILDIYAKELAGSSKMIGFQFSKTGAGTSTLEQLAFTTDGEKPIYYSMVGGVRTYNSPIALENEFKFQTPDIPPPDVIDFRYRYMRIESGLPVEFLIKCQAPAGSTTCDIMIGSPKIQYHAPYSINITDDFTSGSDRNFKSKISDNGSGLPKLFIKWNTPASAGGLILNIYVLAIQGY